MVYGKHFYCSSTIKQSCYGAIHTFIGDQVVSNTQHAQLLHYIPQFGELWLSHYQSMAQNLAFADVGEWHAARRLILNNNQNLFTSALDSECVPDLSDVSGFDDIMMTACLGILYIALDPRTYDGTEVDTAEEKTRLSAKNNWAQLIHFVAAQGWVQWKSQEDVGDTEPVDSGDEQDFGNQAGIEEEDGLVEEHDPAVEEDEPERDNAQVVNDDEVAEDEEEETFHPLEAYDEMITNILPHARYRGPVFFILNFACAVLCLCLDYRRDLAPMDVLLNSLSRNLLDGVGDFFGQEIRAILAELFTEILRTFQKKRGVAFNYIWPTLDLDLMNWIPAPDTCVVQPPTPTADGYLWTERPLDWLMNAESQAAWQAHDAEKKEKDRARTTGRMLETGEEDDAPDLAPGRRSNTTKATRKRAGKAITNADGRVPEESVLDEDVVAESSMNGKRKTARTKRTPGGDNGDQSEPEEEEGNSNAEREGGSQAAGGTTGTVRRGAKRMVQGDQGESSTATKRVRISEKAFESSSMSLRGSQNKRRAPDETPDESTKTSRPKRVRS